MTPRKQALLQGTLDLLILKAVSAGELHGLGVSRRIQQITAGTFHVQPARCFLRCTDWRKRGGSSLAGRRRKTTGAPSTTS